MESFDSDLHNYLNEEEQSSEGFLSDRWLEEADKEHDEADLYNLGD